MERRAVVKTAVGLVLSVALAPRAIAQEADLRAIRPLAGDRFVRADGSRPGVPIAPADLEIGGPRVIVFPLDPKSGLVRDGSRLNKVLLVRLDPETLNEETRQRSADGVVAYSGICTHQACDVTEWQPEALTFWCPCHESRFDPRESARVVEGPAPRRLAALPLVLTGGVLTAAGPFSGPVGAQNR
jgi:Rieske Fe-S protein